MRIRMEQAIYQKLLQVSTKQPFGKQTAVNLQQPKRVKRRDLLTGDVFHRQNARGRVIVDWFGKNDVFKLEQVLCDGVKIVSLDGEIEFAQKTFAQIDKHVVKLV